MKLAIWYDKQRQVMKLELGYLLFTSGKAKAYEVREMLSKIVTTAGRDALGNPNETLYIELPMKEEKSE